MPACKVDLKPDTCEVFENILSCGMAVEFYFTIKEFKFST